MIDLGKYGYYGADPKPVFNTSFYRGEDLYSDGDIENEVIKIIAANPSNKQKLFMAGILSSHAHQTESS